MPLLMVCITSTSFLSSFSLSLSLLLLYFPSDLLYPFLSVRLCADHPELDDLLPVVHVAAAQHHIPQPRRNPSHGEALPGDISPCATVGSFFLSLTFVCVCACFCFCLA